VRKKLEWWGYPKVKKIEDMFKGLDRIPERDRRTYCVGIVRAMHTRRAVKTKIKRHVHNFDAPA